MTPTSRFNLLVVLAVGAAVLWLVLRKQPAAAAASTGNQSAVNRNPLTAYL